MLAKVDGQNDRGQGFFSICGNGGFRFFSSYKFKRGLSIDSKWGNQYSLHMEKRNLHFKRQNVKKNIITDK